MPVFDPVKHYPPHEQDNPFYVQQHGYLLRSQQSTLDEMAAAVDRVSKLQLPVVSTHGPRPFNMQVYLDQIGYCLITRGKVSIDSLKCGPSYFPVNN